MADGGLSFDEMLDLLDAQERRATPAPAPAPAPAAVQDTRFTQSPAELAEVASRIPGHSANPEPRREDPELVAKSERDRASRSVRQMAVEDAQAHGRAQGLKGQMSVEEQMALLDIQEAEAQARANRPISEKLIRGINGGIADTLALPVETVNAALGLAGKNFAENPGDATKAVRDAFNRFGIKTSDGKGKSDIWERIGEEGIKSLLFVGATRMAAPSIQSAAASPTAGQTTGRIVSAVAGPRAGLRAQEIAAAGARGANAVAQQTVQRPVASVAGGVAAPFGAVPGGEFVGQIGEDIGRQLGHGDERFAQAGRAVGELGGQLAGGGLAAAPTMMAADTARNAVAATGRAATRVAGRLPGVRGSQGAQDTLEAIRQGPLASTKPSVPMASTPFADPNRSAADAHYFAQNQIAREVGAIDAGLERAIRTTMSPATARMRPEQVSVRLSDQIDRVYEAARRIEDRFWNRVPMGRPVQSLNRVVNEARRQVAQYERNDPDSIDNGIITRVLDWADDIANGTAQPTIRDVRMMRTAIHREQRVALNGTPNGRAPNAELHRNLVRLDDEILQDIENALPDVVPFQQARAFSLELNNRFTRGVVGMARARDLQHQRRVAPQEVLDAVIANKGGPDAGPRGMFAAASPLGTDPNSALHGAPLQRHGINPQDRIPGSAQLDTAVDEGIRAAYANDLMEVVNATRQGSNPGNATRAAASRSIKLTQDLDGRITWQNAQRQIEGYAAASTQIRRTHEFLIEQANVRDTWARGAYARFAEKDPSTGIASVFNAQNPAMAARDVIRMMSQDPVGGADAVEGFKRGIVDHILTNPSNGETRSFSAIRELINRPQTQRLIGEVFSDPEQGRLNRIMRAAFEFDTADAGTVKRLYRTGGAAIAHIMGLKIGGAIARGLSTGAQGQLSMPARTASVMRRLWLNTFMKGEPGQLVAAAMFDPRVEQIILQRAPSTLRDLKRQVAIGRRAMSAAHAARVTYENQILGTGGESEDE